ncbi:MAG: M23 family metallopeptidase [Bacteroidales bacterium]|nr:M23 family metallopeptidase [Bacteroidales bacterium]
MNNTNKDKKTTHFRLSLLDAKTHQQLKSVRFTRTTFTITIICSIVIICASIYSLIAFTPIREFIPGYPDEATKRTAIRNAIKADSLERVILKWELYSENLRRVLEGTASPSSIDSLMNASRNTLKNAKDDKIIQIQDSLLRKTVMDEQMYEIADRNRRSLPIEGMHFFTPLKGIITQGYDPAVHPFVDIAAAEGTVVNAIADGTVIYTGWSDETGYTIQIQHDADIISIYKHNEKLIKSVGDRVSAGTPIALVGNTGSLSTGPHLHFELWYKGECMDPTKHINF